MCILIVVRPHVPCRCRAWPLCRAVVRASACRLPFVILGGVASHLDGAGRSRLKGLTPNLLGLTHTYYHSLRYHHMQMGNRTTAAVDATGPHTSRAARTNYRKFEPRPKFQNVQTLTSADRVGQPSERPSQPLPLSLHSTHKLNVPPHKLPVL